ncbi:hypothetical protein Tco_0954342 [Tanacetum coccineum]|uniref:Uncharacterized protein n=1 Tax=Tanacetum coccineum TaxID=301880 RepID=A0ABQ5E2K0_9ASTR
MDDAILRYNISKPLPLGGEPGHVTIQPDFFFNKDLEYLRYGRKVGRPAFSISKNDGRHISLMLLGATKCLNRFWILEGKQSIELSKIDEVLDYRVKEFQINRTNPGMNTRFWTKKDVDRSKDFMFAIQKRLKIRRIFQNLESFMGGRIREGDYRLLKRTE